MHRNESISSLIPPKSQRGGAGDESRHKHKPRQLNPSISVKALHDKNKAILPSIESAKHSQDEDPIREPAQVRRNHNIKSIDSMERQLKRKKIVATAEPQEDSYNERQLNNNKNLSISPSAVRLIEPSSGLRIKEQKRIRYGGDRQISDQQKEYKRIVNMYNHQERISGLQSKRNSVQHNQ